MSGLAVEALASVNGKLVVVGVRAVSLDGWDRVTPAAEGKRWNREVVAVRLVRGAERLEMKSA